MTDEKLLAMRGICKSFAGTQVLHGIDFDVRPGEVHALMGENGAGKSTLMKVLAGVHAQDQGTVELAGRPVVLRSPAESRRHGIGIIHQELNVVPEMTVAENLALGSEPTRGGVLDRRRMLQDAQQKLATVGSTIDPRRPMRSLSIGMQQLVEIARAVASHSKVLILDEPTAALTSGETKHLFDLVRRMRDQGVGLIYISHRMEEVWELADRVTVLRDGRYVSTRDRRAVTPHDIVTDMIGRELDDLYERDHRESSTGGLQVRGLGDGRSIGPVDLDVHAGEVVGMFGLIGAGRTEIARMMFGADRAASGTISIEGQQVQITDPTSAIRAGIAMLTEDRKSQGLIPDRGILDNIALPSLGSFHRFGVLRRAAMRGAVTDIADQLSIRRSSLEQSIVTLSGGNQQKALFARWIQTGPRVLILDEPTRGVDIGAKREIYKTINDLAAAGLAVLMISSDLPEVIGMSDRVLVVRDGQLVDSIPRARATEESIMLGATGVAPQEKE